MMSLEALLQIADEKVINGHSLGYESEEKSNPIPRSPKSGSTWSEPPQTSVYTQPKSFSMSGQKGQDRYGHVDNEVEKNDYLSTTGRTGGDADKCPKCGGSGVLDEHSCPQCNGTGIIENDGQDYQSTPEVESAYESAQRSGAHGIENDDGPMFGRFDYPNDHPPAKALDFPRSFKKINSSYADWSGMGQNAIQDVPDDYKASTLFVDMAPYRPTIEKGKEKYGTSVEQNNLNQMVSDYQKDMGYKKFNGRMENPGKVDEALWTKAKDASQDAFGAIKYPFVSWWYQKQGGTFE